MGDQDDKIRGLENSFMEKQANLEESMATEIEAQRQELTSELDTKQQQLIDEINTRKQEQEASFDEFQKQFAELQASAALESAMRRADAELAERRQIKALETIGDELRGKLEEMSESQLAMKMKDAELETDIETLKGSLETDYNAAKEALEQQQKTSDEIKESLQKVQDE